MTTVEYEDRYTGTEHEGKPHLRGCWGPCEAMGVMPSVNPLEWPILPEALRLPHPVVGQRLADLATMPGQAYVYVGPYWDRGQRMLRFDGEPTEEDFLTALIERGYWIPETAVDDGWAFIGCPDCNATGNVSRLTAIRRLPREVAKTANAIWYAHGDQGWPPSVKHPGLKTRVFYLTNFLKDAWRSMRWEPVR